MQKMESRRRKPLPESFDSETVCLVPCRGSTADSYSEGKHPIKGFSWVKKLESGESITTAQARKHQNFGRWIGWVPGVSGFVVLDVDEDKLDDVNIENLVADIKGVLGEPSGVIRTPKGRHMVYAVAGNFEDPGNGGIYFNNKYIGEVRYKKGYCIIHDMDTALWKGIWSRKGSKLSTLSDFVQRDNRHPVTKGDNQGHRTNPALGYMLAMLNVHEEFKNRDSWLGVLMAVKNIEERIGEDLQSLVIDWSAGKFTGRQPDNFGDVEETYKTLQSEPEYPAEWLQRKLHYVGVFLPVVIKKSDSRREIKAPRNMEKILLRWYSNELKAHPFSFVFRDSLDDFDTTAGRTKLQAVGETMAGLSDLMLGYDKIHLAISAILKNLVVNFGGSNYVFNGTGWKEARDGETNSCAYSMYKVHRMAQHWMFRNIILCRMGDTKDHPVNPTDSALKVPKASSSGKLYIIENESGRFGLCPRELLLDSSGVIHNIRTGEKERPEAQRYMLDMRAAYTPDENMETPVFEKFLRDCFGDEEEFITWIWDVIGYIIGGSNRDQKFIMLIGGPGRGKSIFANVIMKILGSYAKALSSEHFYLGDSSHPEWVIDLYKSRAAHIPEIAGTSRRLNEALIKQITGGDEIYARAMYGRSMGVRILATILASSNSVPKFSLETGINRRLAVIPFDYDVEEPDPFLESKILEEAPGILHKALDSAHRNFDSKELFTSRVSARVVQASERATSTTRSIAAFIQESVEIEEELLAETKRRGSTEESIHSKRLEAKENGFTITESELCDRWNLFSGDNLTRDKVLDVLGSSGLVPIERISSMNSSVIVGIKERSVDLSDSDDSAIARFIYERLDVDYEYTNTMGNAIQRRNTYKRGYSVKPQDLRQAAKEYVDASVPNIIKLITAAGYRLDSYRTKSPAARWLVGCRLVANQAEPQYSKSYVIDTETTSKVDLKKTNAYVYAAHKTTKVMMVSWAALEGTDKGHWRMGDDPSDMLEILNNPDIALYAFNAQFDREVINKSLTRDIPGLNVAEDGRWVCIKAFANYLNMPGSLNNCAWFLDAGEKIDEGKDLIKKYSVKGNGEDLLLPENKEDFDRFSEYCNRDVQMTKKVVSRIRAIPGWVDLESTVILEWRISEEINSRGVFFDADLAEDMIQAAEKIRAMYDERIGELTKWECGSTRERKLATWIFERIPAHMKQIWNKPCNSQPFRNEALKEDLDDKLREVLQICDNSSGTLASKFVAMDKEAGPDGRLRGQFVINGARTGRYKSRGVQLHNIPRQEAMHELIARLRGDDQFRQLRTMDKEGHQPNKVIISSIRKALIPAPGNVFVVADYSQIESRLLNYLAYVETKCEAALKNMHTYKEGGDVYLTTASDILGRNVEPEEKDKRLIYGKIPTLALGYQGGVQALLNIAKMFDVDLSEKVCMGIVDSWRAVNKGIALYWQLLNKAIRRCMYEVEAKHKTFSFFFTAGNKCMRSCINLRLPSGRNIKLWEPHQEDKQQNGWGSSVEACVGVMTTEGNLVYDMYFGGRLCENLISGTALDLLQGAITNVCRDRQMRSYAQGQVPVVMHVHDEIVLEVSEKYADAASRKLEEIMAKPPPYLPRMPIAVDVSVMGEYRK